MPNLELWWLWQRLTKIHQFSVCLSIFNMIYSIYFTSIQVTISIKIEVWLVTPCSLTNGTTISEPSAASVFSVPWNHTTYHHFWKYCNSDAHHWTLQMFVVNVSICSHTEFPALYLSCEVKSVTFSWSWDKTLT